MPSTSFGLDVEELIDAGDNVVVVVRLRLRVRNSRGDVNPPEPQVCKVCNGKIVVDGHAYLTKEEALKAAALEE